MQRELHWKNRPLLIYTRIKKHSSQNTSEIYNHITTGNEFNYIKNILQITPYDDTTINCSPTDLIFTNTKIIDKSEHWLFRT